MCQKYVRAQYGKDPVILARAILETNEIVLVFPVYILHLTAVFNLRSP